MLHTKLITKEMNDFGLFKDLYYTAFPKSEQIPMAFLLRKAKKDGIRFNAYYDEDIFVGFTYTITDGDLTYLLYLATRADIRSKGYGRQILNHIRTTYPVNRLVLNCLAEDENADDNEMRKRRQNFYFRNGYAYAGFSCKMNGNSLIVLAHNCHVTPEEFLGIFKKFWGSIFFAFFKPKMRE